MEVRPLSADLSSPDPIGRDLALYRIRVYRFSEDRRHYVLAEELEERHIAGEEPRAATLAYVRTTLDMIRTSGEVPDFDASLAEAEGIDTQTGLRARKPYEYRNVRMTTPDRVVAIVGAPRSGTSHLFNLLARQGGFAYFTTVSCWAWPTRNLTRPGRRPFTQLGPEVFAVDNKQTRLIPGLVMPYEAEDVFARAIPTYQHVAGHRYELTEARIGALKILQSSTAAHLQHFKTGTLLLKSPFNSLRIPILEEMWGKRIRYIHIVRDRHAVAESMRRHHIEFSIHDKHLAAEEAWSLFTSAVERDAPGDRCLTVTQADVLNRPIRVLAELTN